MIRQTRIPHWLPYEVRRLGQAGLAMPVVVATVCITVSALADLFGAERYHARVLTAGLEVGMSLAAGITAAHIVVSEPAADLHLTLKTSYRTTLLRRLALFTGWTSLFALMWAVSLLAAGLWDVPGPFLSGQLAWISPLVWFISAGTLLALLTSSRATVTALLGLLWVFQNSDAGATRFLQNDRLSPFFLFATTHAPGADFWLENRLAVISFAGVLFVLALPLMTRDPNSRGDT